MKAIVLAGAGLCCHPSAYIGRAGEARRRSMGLLGNLGRVFKAGLSRKRSWAPAEVRELIDARQLDLARTAANQLSENLAERDAERDCLLGEISFQARADDDAIGYFGKALKAVPSMPAAHHGLSLLQGERGDFASAVRHAFFAHCALPNDPRFLAQLGYCQLQLKNYPLAEAPLRRATLLAPSNAYAWNNLGIVLRLKGEWDEAADCFRRAVTLQPDDHSASENLAQIAEERRRAGLPDIASVDGDDEMPSGPSSFAEMRSAERDGRLQDAIDLCEALVLRAVGDQPEPVLELHRLYTRAGDPQSGIDALQAYLAQQPGNIPVTAALGLAKLDMRELKSAEELLRAVAEARPDDLAVLLGLGQAIAGQERFAEAGQWLDRALAGNPSDLKTRAMHAANLVNQCRYDEGLVACRQLQDEGLHIPALGIVLAYLGRFDEALATLNEHVRHHPNDPNVRFHRGSVRLLQLDFEGGWEDYAYRGFSTSENFRVLPFPLWRGEALEGKKIVVLAEQGLGDQVMFANCLPDLLERRPAEVVVEVIRRIAPTLARSFPQCRVIATSQSRRLEWVKDCPDMDYYVPLGDLPRYFRRSLDAFPRHDGYLVPDPLRVAHWRRRLEESGPGPYVGMSWKGGTEGTRTSLRSLTPLDFLPLSQRRSATWVCLQYGAVQEAVDEAARHGYRLAYWPESISDLDEFAALIAALDLVITVCNTTVHYAGGLGKPVWVLAPSVPEWRYGAKNVTLPWYPSSRIFRQTALGDWSGVMSVVGQQWLGWGLDGTSEAAGERFSA